MAVANFGPFNGPKGGNGPMMNEQVLWELANPPQVTRWARNLGEGIQTRTVAEYLAENVERAKQAGISTVAVVMALALAAANNDHDQALANMAAGANGNIQQLRHDLTGAEAALSTLKIAVKISSVVGAMLGVGFVYEKAVNYMTQGLLEECEQDVQEAHKDIELSKKNTDSCLQLLEQN